MSQHEDQLQAGAQSLDNTKEIIASLCAGAPTDNIRNCLRKYDPEKTAYQIEKDMKKDKKEILVDTLQYLGIPGMSQYRQDALPHEVVCRLQNLFPDNCSLCNSSYCVKLGEKPIISSVRCGQGCHNKCVLEILGKTEDELDESNNHGLSLLNPFSTLGLFYICAYCQEEVIPNKENLRVRQGQGGKRTNNSPTEAGENNNNIANDLQNGVDNNSDSQIDNAINVPPSQGNNSNEIGTEVAQAQGSTANSSRTEVNHQSNGRQNTPLSTQSRVNDPPICKHYRTGRCKFGVSGKKDGSCPYSHPKACTKFLTNGSRSRGGCTKGSSCRLFHPSMCHSSMQERNCTRENCKFMHIKGTQRSTGEPTQSTNQGRSDVNQKTSPQPPQQSSAQNKDAPISNSQSFLDIIKVMQEQLSQVTSKLQQLDDNYTRLCYQQMGYPFQMKYPPTHIPPPTRPLNLQGQVLSFPNQAMLNSQGLQPSQ